MKELAVEDRFRAFGRTSIVNDAAGASAILRTPVFGGKWASIRFQL